MLLGCRRAAPKSLRWVSIRSIFQGEDNRDAARIEERELQDQVRILGSRGEWEQMLSAIETAKLDGVKVTRSALRSAFIALGEVGPVSNLKALALLHSMKDANVTLDAEGCKAAIKAIPRQSVKAAMKEFKKQGHEVTDPELYEAAVLKVGKGDHGDIGVALSLVNDMKRLGLTPTYGTQSMLLTLCQRHRRPETALAILREMGNTALPKDFTKVLACCSQSGQWKEALHLLDTMKSSDNKPNLVHYATAITALGNAENWSRAVSMLKNDIRDAGLVPDDSCYQAGIHACSGGGNWRGALELIDNMTSDGLVPSTVAYSCAINACAKGNNWEAAVDLLEEMRRCGAKPNTVAYNSALNACARCGEWQTALGLLEEMKGLNLRLNPMTYTCAIRALGPRWERAEELMLEMESRGVEPDERCYRAMVNSLVSAGEVEQAHRLIATAKEQLQRSQRQK
ncbi:unnamed protein product [Chrysoparadoxa australica]